MLKKLQESGVGYEDLNRLYYESETARIKAALSAAEAEASFQKEQREKCTVMALEDGIVTDLPVKELSFITAGQPAADSCQAWKQQPCCPLQVCNPFRPQRALDAH